MRLVNFSVTNFRSITAAHKIPISNATILIGKNNEGKSNILKALALAMRLLQEHAIYEGRRRAYRAKIYKRDERIYFWERDFPISLQNRKRSKQTILRLEFALSKEEIDDFKKEIKSSLNGTLPIEIRISEDNRPSIKVQKRGRGSKTLNSKSSKITEFIAKRIFFNYIPAIRTDQEAISIIREMLFQELRQLEHDDNYQEAIHIIYELQQKVLNNLASRIKEPLSEFLPSIKNVNIYLTDYRRFIGASRDFEIIIDDGTPTSIEFKGEGVKSLATLGLLKNRSIKGGASIIAIEEPESHLHPAAIHQLNKIISSLSNDNQIIITTHNPLFVDRLDVKSNIIIDSGRARPARKIHQIREVLGIKASDNLINANFVLIVEGEEDRIALQALLSTMSKSINLSLKNNFLIIQPIGGAGNLSYKLSLLKNSLCVYHVLLDNDKAGKKAFSNAEKDDLLDLKSCTFITCPGMPESEFEDCINVDIYQSSIKENFGVTLGTLFKGNKKWSERMMEVFHKQGKIWNDKIEKEVKRVVAECIAKKPKKALNSHKRASIDSLINNLEEMLGS